ncbi:unnamed protein product [Urochloa decumbens]|uniref:F-box domain-containing protein n=1 Tax=Urochloa decumbens TaxID=240449 RepID=A0ABC9D8J3_9POAL
MAVEESQGGTQVGDLPEVCLALAIALTSPRDASRCAAVSPSFQAAADSDHVWRRFLPDDLVMHLQSPPHARKRKIKTKDAYLDLCDAAGAVTVGGGAKVWLEKASGAKCYALSARSLSLPWDDGEFCWRFTPHPTSRFGEVAELVECTCLDIYGRLPAAALSPATPYAAYLVYGSVEEGRRRGLSFPDQETAVSVGGRTATRHAVCLWPDDTEARKLRAGAAAAAGGEAPPRRPRRRGDGWWEVEMGRLCTSTAAGEGEDDDVVAGFEVMGWQPKRGLVLEGIEFRPVVN